MKLKYMLLMCVLVLCSACMETLNVQNQTDKMARALDHYGADLRWGRYREAYAYHIHRDGTKSRLDLERLEGFSVTSFTPIEPALNKDASGAVVPIEIKYYNEQYGTLRTYKETQKWWYNDELNMWLIETDFPDLN